MEDTKLALELKLANFNRVRKELMKGTLTWELYSVELQKITEHVLVMISGCERDFNTPQEDSLSANDTQARMPLHPNHQFTCDRID